MESRAAIEKSHREDVYYKTSIDTRTEIIYSYTLHQPISRKYFLHTSDEEKTEEERTDYCSPSVEGLISLPLTGV